MRAFTSVLISIIFFATKPAFAQLSMVKDGSFEDTTAIWQDYFSTRTLHDWWGTDTSSVSNYIVNFWKYTSLFRIHDVNILRLPNNQFFNNTYPKFGHGAIGIEVYTNKLSEPVNPQYFRSVIKGAMHNTLQQGKEYCITVYAKPEKRANYYRTNGISVYCDNGGIDTLYTIHKDSSGAYTSITPSLQCSFIIDDTTQWTKIQGTFIANGTETRITIGNFQNDSMMMKTINYGDSFAYCYCSWLLIDNLSVVPADAHDWLGNTYYSSIADSVWVGLNKFDYADGKWYDIAGNYITTGPGFWLSKINAEAGKKYVHEIDVCGVIKRDTTVLVVAPEGIDNLELKKENVRVYPNPASTFLTVEQLQFSRPQELIVSNVFGQKIFSTTLIHKTEIETSSWARGVYVVKVGEVVKKVVLE